MFHAAVLALMVFGVMGLLSWQWPHTFSSPPAEQMLGFGPMALVLAILSMTGVALGLLLSACVATPDRANTLLPYVLIPQIILGGGILMIKDGILYVVAVVLSPAYWGYRALHRGATTLPKDIPLRMDYN